MALPEVSDDLYGLPLDAFTAARNELARRLRGEGRRDDAAEIAALRKPSPAAWTVNQLVRERRKDVDALLEAAAAIRRGDAGGDTALRDALDRLLRAARALLEAAGRKPSDTLLREVATTLRATAAAAPEELAAGRLTEAREASGFADALAGVGEGRPRPRRATQAARERRPAVDRTRLAAARRAVADAEEELRVRRRAASAAERDAERARAAVEEAEGRHAEARAALEALRAPAGGKR